MTGRGTYILSLCLLGTFVFPITSNAQDTQSAKMVETYIDRGGFQAFELDSTDNDIKDVIEKLYGQKGEYFEPNFTIHTEGGSSFTGTVIQITDHYVVLLDQTRSAPRNTDLKALHVVERSEIVSVSANILSRN